MSLLSPSASRGLVLAALLVLALSACGRRGRLEAPPDPIAVAAEQQRQAERDRVKARPGSPGASIVAPAAGGAAQAEDDDDEEAVTGPAIAPTPAPRTKSPRRGFTVPKDPFILDPLL